MGEEVVRSSTSKSAGLRALVEASTVEADGWELDEDNKAVLDPLDDTVGVRLAAAAGILGAGSGGFVSLFSSSIDPATPSATGSSNGQPRERWSSGAGQAA